MKLAPDTGNAGTVRAISAETGATVWLHEHRAATMSLVATGGGLVFGGDLNGRFRAFNHETGEVLWEINLGSAVTGFPITYAVDGRRFVAVSTGSGGTSSHFTGLTPELRPSAERRVYGNSHLTIAGVSTNVHDARRRSAGVDPGPRALPETALGAATRIAMKPRAGRPPDLADLDILLKEAGIETRREAAGLRELAYGTEPMAADEDLYLIERYGRRRDWDTGPTR